MTSSGPPKRYFAPGPTEPLGSPDYYINFCYKKNARNIQNGGFISAKSGPLIRHQARVLYLLILWFTASASSESAMLNCSFYGDGAGKGRKDLHRLVFCVHTTRKLSQLSWKKLAVKFEQAQISCKLAQATASHRKLAVKRGTGKHKKKTCDDLRSRLIWACINCQLLYSISRCLFWTSFKPVLIFTRINRLF